MVNFVAQLPQNSKYDARRHGRDNVAVEFVEGWSVRRIALAVILVVVLSVAATVLWTTFGVEASFVARGGSSSGDGSGNGNGEDVFGGKGTREALEGGFRGAGTRVGTGVLLGLLVLFLGWTGVGAWVVLSWLVS